MCEEGKSYQECCRLCLDERRQKVPLSPGDREVISRLTEATIKPDDGPQQICNKCSSFITLIIEFVEEVKQSFQTLKNSLPLKDESEVGEDLEEESQIEAEYVVVCENQKSPEKPARPKRKRERLQPYKCPSCEKTFEAPSKLRRHLRVHSKDPSDLKFQCNVCLQELQGAIKLKRHMLTHLSQDGKPRLFACEACGKEYLESASLKSHMAIKHSSEVATFPCRICGFSFTRKNYRDYHEREHSGTRPLLKCSFQECAYQTSRKNNLLRHVKIHQRPPKLTLNPS